MGRFQAYLAKDVICCSSKINVPKEDLGSGVSRWVYGLTSLTRSTDLATWA